ncbi:ankyrin repeat domain-containing protein 55 isoform X2 [Strongylocentrotus purpuratus]|uniref:Ankyrin repeat domain-containing protein 55 n=1 Tax=Strongylocentrotus purpuratus TaxID=7668 RepID=A0A7M7RFP2_STRPU|nr:ankyrin repeat domain-containing protein 55 isoform X2 [Strongylocentrotus purpuratus]
MDFARSDLLDMGDDDCDDEDNREPEDNIVLAHQAAASGNIPLLMEAFNQDPSVLESCDEKGMTPLSHSVLSKKLDMFKFLLKMGANINTQDALGRTPLCLAAYEGWYEGVVCLLRHGAKQTIVDKSGRLPLHAATCDKESRTLSALLQSLSINDIDKPDNEGMTALHWAAFHNRPEHIQLLMLRGGDIYQTDIDEKTPLHWASQNGSLVCSSVMAKCHSGGAPLINATEATGKTCVHLAAAAGHHEILLEFAQIPSVDFEALDPDERTPLHWAAVKGHVNCVKVLLELGVCPSPVDLDGSTPHQYSIQAGKSEATKLLEGTECGLGQDMEEPAESEGTKDGVKKKRFAFLTSWLDKRKNTKSQFSNAEKKQDGNFEDVFSGLSHEGSVQRSESILRTKNDAARHGSTKGAIGFDVLSDDPVLSTEDKNINADKSRTTANVGKSHLDDQNSSTHLHRRTDHDTQIASRRKPRRRQPMEGELQHSVSEPHIGSSYPSSPKHADFILDNLSLSSPQNQVTVVTNGTTGGRKDGREEDSSSSNAGRLMDSGSSLLVKPFFRAMPNAEVLQQQAKEILEAQKTPGGSHQQIKTGRPASGRARSSLDHYGFMGRPNSPKLAPISAKPRRLDSPGELSVPPPAGFIQQRSSSLTWESWENHWREGKDQIRQRPDVLEPIRHNIVDKSKKKRKKKQSSNHLREVQELDKR